MSERVASVTVAFDPEPGRLAQQLAALASQVDEMIVVENGSRPSVRAIAQVELARHPIYRHPALRIVELPGNAGVARGLNAGIEAARARGAQLALLLDHDSVPAPDMVARLLAARALDAARRVAAWGPRVKDLRDAREYPFVQLGWLSNRHVRCQPGSGEVVACDFLISSGTLLPIDVLAEVGAFEDGLFIDSVDREWCFRALARGFALRGVCGAELDHRLGDHRRRVAGGVELVVHSPERLYYMTRNRLLLYQRRYVPLKWKLKDFLRVLAKFAATMLFVAPRGEYARMTGRAVRDALAKRAGKLGDSG